MSVLTKQRGLKAIERAGGVAAATFALKEGYRYPIARGHRIAETNRQLDDGPMTGADLFADLESRNWLLPEARRRYRLGEFREHLKYMVKKGRLHVLTGVDLNAARLEGLAARREWDDRRDRIPPMPGSSGQYISALRTIIRHVGPGGVARDTLYSIIEAEFPKDVRWLRQIMSSLIHADLLRQEGSRVLAPHRHPTAEFVVEAIHNSVKFVGELLLEIDGHPRTQEEIAQVAKAQYGVNLGKSGDSYTPLRNRRGWLESANLIKASGRPLSLEITPKGRKFLRKLQRTSRLVAPSRPKSTGGTQSTGKLGAHTPGGRKKARSIRPTHENLVSDQATKPLTAWLIQTARQRGTMTYGRAKVRLESECGFEAVFTVAVGRVAGAAMNKILEVVPDAPLLNVLLVQAGTSLPGSGAVQYLADRYPGRRWLRKGDAHKDGRWRDLIEEEAARVYGYKHWNTVYRQIYDIPLPAPSEIPEGKERHGKRRRGGGEGPNHKALRLRVTEEPSLVRRGLRPENTDTEVELLSGDRVDVVSASNDGTVAIEVKSRDSDVNDVERGVYQCVKYRAVLEAQDIRRKPIVESWLVTETPLPGELKALARRLKVRTKVIKPE